MWPRNSIPIEEKSAIEFLIKKKKEDPKRREIELVGFQKLVEYCEATSCRRKFLLNYFGEKLTTFVSNYYLYLI